MGHRKVALSWIPPGQKDTRGLQSQGWRPHSTVLGSLLQSQGESECMDRHKSPKVRLESSPDHSSTVLALVLRPLSGS